MISSHVSHGKSKEAVELYGNMLVEGVLPDAYTFSAIFKAFSELGLLCHGQRAHGLAVVLGLEVLDGFVASAIVDMYAKFDKMMDAHFVFDRVLEKDVVLRTALIVGYAQHGLDGVALEVFEDMVDRGIKPNEYALASILISCGNLGDLVKVNYYPSRCTASFSTGCSRFAEESKLKAGDVCFFELINMEDAVLALHIFRANN